VVAAGFQPAVKPGILPAGFGSAMAPALNLRLVPDGWKPPSTATRMVAATNPGGHRYTQVFRWVQRKK
jgi:hypothetical protein